LLNGENQLIWNEIASLSPYVLARFRCADIRLDLAAIESGGAGMSTAKKKRARSLRVIETRLAFADTELKVTAVDVTTGQLVNAAVQFFNA